MADSYYTEQFLQALEEAIASGASTVSYEGKSIGYRSLDDMLRTADIIRRRLGLTTQKTQTIIAAHDRGFR